MGGEPLAYVSIGLTVLTWVGLYIGYRAMKEDVDLIPILQERLNEDRKKVKDEENRVIGRIDRLDKDWRALFAANERYVADVEKRVQKLEDSVEEIQGHRRAAADINRIT